MLSAEAVDRGKLHLAPDEMRALGVDIDVVEPDDNAADGCELVLVLGRRRHLPSGAELARNVSVPVLGVNLGRIGFLAEAEADAIDDVLEHIVARDYRVEDRMTLDVSVRADGQVIGQGWAINEASLEKGTHLGVLGVVLEVDGRPCRSSAATAYWSPHRPVRPPIRFPRAGPSCGPTSRRCWWCPTTLTRYSRGRW